MLCEQLLHALYSQEGAPLRMEDIATKGYQLRGPTSAVVGSLHAPAYRHSHRILFSDAGHQSGTIVCPEEPMNLLLVRFRKT